MTSREELQRISMIETSDGPMITVGDLIPDAFEVIDKDLNKLERLKTKPYLLYSKRLQIANEYVAWCRKYKVEITEPTNMVTWFVSVKLKEWLNE